MATGNKLTCQKCGKTLSENRFYTYKDGSKCELCKPCLTMHIDNFDPNTFTWILKKFDLPYIPSEWDVLLNNEYKKKQGKLDGLSIIGKYMSKMKLIQWRSYGWEDTEALMKKYDDNTTQNQQDRERESKKAKEMFENGEISEAEYRTYTSTLEQKNKDEEDRIQAIIQAAIKGEDMALKGAASMLSTTSNSYKIPNRASQQEIVNYYDESKFTPIDEIPDLSDQLTKEDKEYLLLKWGRNYTPNQWIELEKKYNDMMESFDIQDSDSISTLILICKTYLKTNEALDAGDYDGYTKLSKVYNDLRKTSKFTASQLKEQKQGEFDSVGQIVAWCEKHGGEIPKFQIDAPLDVVDVILTDMKGYVKSLFTQDTTMGNALDNYLTKKKNSKEETIKEKNDKDYIEYAERQAMMEEYDDMILGGEY